MVAEFILTGAFLFSACPDRPTLESPLCDDLARSQGAKLNPLVHSIDRTLPSAIAFFATFP